METVEVLALLAAVLFCLAVLWRSTSPAVQVVRDPGVAHLLLNEKSDALRNRPNRGILTTLATFTGGPERDESIATVAYGPHWRSLRSNLTAGFLNPSRIAALAPLQQDTVQDLVTGLSAAGGEVVVMREHLDRAMFALAARMCLGDGVEESCVCRLQHVLADLTQAIDDAVWFDGSTLGKLMHWRRLRRLVGLFVPLGDLVRPLIAASRARARARARETAPVDDSRHAAYLDSLVDLRVPDEHVEGGNRALGDNQILGLVAEFIITNSGVIAACIEWTLANLVIQPEVQKKLRREIDEAVAGDAEAGLSQTVLAGLPYLRAVVLESLRMHPPSAFVTRGVYDPASDRLTKRVIFLVRDIGRHGGAWTDADQFRPERFLPGGEADGVGHMAGHNEIRMIPFGGGRRFCPGSSLALLQAKFFLVALMRHFELAPTSCGVDLTETGNFHNLMKKPLRVRVTPRNFP